MVRQLGNQSLTCHSSDIRLQAEVCFGAHPGCCQIYNQSAPTTLTVAEAAQKTHAIHVCRWCACIKLSIHHWLGHLGLKWKLWIICFTCCRPALHPVLTCRRLLLVIISFFWIAVGHCILFSYKSLLGPFTRLFSNRCGLRTKIEFLCNCCGSGMLVGGSYP